jgi:phosphoribosyl-ATP pyrophosphohydrolase/phosphoribosyl-AMP cyclohydrolase
MQKLSEFDTTKLDWTKTDGLIPAVVQDARTMRVLMLGYVNTEALKKTLDTGLVTFFSRTKQRLWQKGETSGHVLHLRDIKIDCDNDTLLMLVEPVGPTCHTGTTTCFGDVSAPSLAVLADLAAVIHERRVNPTDSSYTTKLFAEGITRIAQKVGEEGVETALAAATHGENLRDEAADLLYHLLVLLESANVDWLDILKILQSRASKRK